MSQTVIEHGLRPPLGVQSGDTTIVPYPVWVPFYV